VASTVDEERVADEVDDELLPGGPEPTGEEDDDEEEDVTNQVLARLDTVSPGVTDGDAWVDSPKDGETSDDTVALAMGATLQDLKVSRAQNGNNFDITFEVGIENIEKLAVAAKKGGHDVTWKKLAVGSGAEIRRFGVSRDADAGLHLKVIVRLPQSEVSRSVGRLGPLVGTHALLELDPMQGTLNLPGGQEIDLTKRA
jgi:hypothetical protein